MLDSTAGSGDPVARKYEQLWQQEELPRLHQFVAAQGLLTTGQLLAVVRVDMRERWRRRQGMRAAVYFTNYPSLEDHPQGYRLVCDEVAGRRAMGESVDVQAVVRQFPQWARLLAAELPTAGTESDAAAVEKEALATLLDLPPAGGPEPTVLQPVPAPAPDTRPPEPTPTAEAGGLRVVGPGYRFNDRYRVERELGQGGMGKVFLARDEQLGRRVAVKVIRPQDPRLLDSTRHRQEFARAFVEEAHIGAGLDHPNIAKVFDFGIEHGEPFTVFEYVEGETLKELLARRGRLPLEEVRDIIAALAQGLAYAHERGIVHRDLKPANVRVTSLGEAKILDLGLAARFREQADWRYCGTPAYVAPEQVAGLPCDGRTDQYALAAITYELLTGGLPFRGPDVGAVLDPGREKPPDARKQVADLPAAVAVAIQRGLAKRPAERYDTCEDFASALGCQLVRRGADAPSFLRLVRLVGAGGRFRASARTTLGTQDDSLFLALASDGLYAWYRDDVTSWPLADIGQASRKGTSLTLYDADGKKFQVFTFANQKPCERFCAELEELLESPQARRGSDTAPADGRRSVVLLPNRIRFPHQVLGTVSHEAKSKTAARAGVQIQAQLLGADAVADLELERLPTFFNTGYRCTGVAVRAVDREGRLQLGAFWLEKRAAALSVWILAAVGLFLALVLRGLATGSSGHPENWQVLPYFLGAAAFPVAGALLLRLLRWPQLVLPVVAFTVVFLIGAPLIMVLGAAETFANLGGWAMALTPLALADPIPWTSLFSSIFLGLRTRQFLREYRQLLTAYQPEPSWRRRLGAGVAWASVAAFALTALGISGAIVWETTGGFSLTNSDAGKAKRAVDLFQAGHAHLQDHPDDAEPKLSEALGLFEELERSQPSNPGFRHMVARTHINLGAIAFGRHQADKAERHWNEALRRMEALVRERPDDADSKPYPEMITAIRAQLATLHEPVPLAPPEPPADLPAPPVAPPDPDAARKMAEDAVIALKMEKLDRFMDELGAAATANPADLPRLEPKCQEAVDLLESLPARAAQDKKVVVARMTVFMLLGNIRSTQNKPAEAEAFLAKAQPAVDQLHKELPENRDVTYMHANQLALRGRVQLDLGRVDDADAGLREALAILRKLIADPATAKPYWWTSLPVWLQWQADVYRSRSQWTEAAACLDEALGALDKARAALPGQVPALAGSFREELLQDRRAVRARLAQTHLDHAAKLEASGQFREAVAAYDRALELCPAEDQLRHRCRRARCLVLAGDREAAVAEVASGPGMKQAGAAESFLRARVIALAAATEPNAEQAKVYADTALVALRVAVDRGFKDVASLKQLDDLKALRARPEFQALVRKLEGPSKK